jgi:hypothetical protein
MIAAHGGERGMSLLIETEILVLAAFAVGLGVGWLFFRPKRDHFL